MTVAAGLLFALFSGAEFAAGAEFFVAKSGNDAWSGTLAEPNVAKSDGPFTSLERAREAVRQHRKINPEASHTVSVRTGVYELARPLVLTEEDSGTEAAPVSWRNYRDERVVLTGGRALAGFQAVTDGDVLKRLPAAARGQVRVIDLKSIGVTDFGDAAAEGKRAELFFNSRPMTLARWPNDGFIRIAKVTGGKPITVHGLAGDALGKFTIAEDRLPNWSQETDLRVCGYWFWDWSDERQKVKSLDPRTRTIELELPSHYYGYRQGQRFYVFNALSELDAPGEWYLDRQAGQLYFWPPAPSNPQTEQLPALSVLPTAITLQDASWIVLRGLVIEQTRSHVITIAGGRGVKVAGCLIRNAGGWGVTINGGLQNGVVGCDLEQTGEGGISLSGGNRQTLSPGGHFADNNHIHQYSRLVRAYRPAVGLTGVGHRAAHNVIHDAPHTAILNSGNDHLIEFNEIYHVCQETGDVGAFYMGRDWSMRGTVVRHNYFHDLSAPGLHGAMAVYLDDAASGVTIFGNLFYRAGRAAFIGGGRDNVVENNIFVDCKPSVHVDARGLNWMQETVAPGGFMHQQLAAMPYQSAPWSVRYPELARINQENPAAPHGNKVLRNISTVGVWQQVEPAAQPGVTFKNNLVDQDPAFVDSAKLNFQLQPTSPAYALGFKKIPLEQIGLEQNEWRTKLKP